jgi:hypothetical protein
MSMNPAQRIMAAHAQGMGDLGADGPWVDPSTVGVPPPIYYPTAPTSGHSTLNSWLTFGTAVGNDIAAIIARNNNQNSLGYPQQPTGQQPYYPQVVVPAPSGVGIGVDGQGIRLSDGSHISWLVIAGGVGVFMLLQHPGFSRRR